MVDPENSIKISAGARVAAAASVFAITLWASLPHHTKQSLAERCQDEYPFQPVGLTLNDYLGEEEWGGELHPKPDYAQKSVLQILKSKINTNKANEYQISAERTKQIDEHVNHFAAGMVERANAGDETYKFYVGGGGAFLDGNFITGPNGGLHLAPSGYEGFGWLWRDVPDVNGEIVKQEIADNIYRYKDGTYYAHPEPWILSVADKNAQSTFEAPPALGLVRCASVPGNGATQGWRVAQYDFNHLYEPGSHTVQLEPFMNQGSGLADFQLADQRAFHFIDNRYEPFITVAP